MKMFEAEKIMNQCVEWIRSYFAENGPDCNAVVGLSGGKDSSVTAALCVRALGKDRVIGVLLPNGVQEDIDYAYLAAEFLEIRYYVLNIQKAYQSVLNSIGEQFPIDGATKLSLPARLRMVSLYAVAQSNNGRVANTCNLSEDWVGYATRYGDGVGDFSPLSGLTVQEVKTLGRHLGLPVQLVEKVPIDGLCGKTDEDNLGFTYAVLDRYIRTGEIDDEETKAKIDRMHRLNLYKLPMMPAFDPCLSTIE